eukprot:758219-Hanusia_phi.AAC.3
MAQMFLLKVSTDKGDLNSKSGPPRYPHPNSLVGPKHHVPPHEQVPKVEDEALRRTLRLVCRRNIPHLVMHMMVSSGSEADLTEERVPGMRDFTAAWREMSDPTAGGKTCARGSTTTRRLFRTPCKTRHCSEQSCKSSSVLCGS